MTEEERNKVPKRQKGAKSDLKGKNVSDYREEASCRKSNEQQGAESDLEGKNAFDCSAEASCSKSNATEEDFTDDDDAAASVKKRKANSEPDFEGENIDHHATSSVSNAATNKASSSGSTAGTNNAIDNDSDSEDYSKKEYYAIIYLVNMKHQHLSSQSYADLRQAISKVTERQQEAASELPVKPPITAMEGQPEAAPDNRVEPPTAALEGEEAAPDQPPIAAMERQQEAAPEHPVEPPIAALEGLVGECSRPYWKTLTRTDVKDDQMRLCLKRKHAEDYLLPLLDRTEDVRNGINVIVYDSEGQEYSMSFRLWSGKMYVLTGKGWKRFYKEHGLTEEHEITLWMFRHTQTHKICFAITYR